MEKQKIQITVPANLQHSSLIRHIADEVFGIAKFDKAWCSRLKLVVDELYMNAVRYGSTEFKSYIYITFAYDDTEVQFKIEDDGTGPNAKSADELKEIIEKNEGNTDLTRTSGRGLSMITKVWTDDMTVETSEHGGIAITVTKKISALSEPPPPLPPTEIVQKTAEKFTAHEPEIQLSETPSSEGITSETPVYDVKLSGEIDRTNIDEKVAPIVDKIQAMPEGAVLALDFSDVSYINSIFIGYLASWYTAMSRKKGHVMLKNINNDIKEVLDLVGLLNVLEFKT